MSNQLKPFLHRSTGESYLFGYEDFLDLKDLEHIWDIQLWENKDSSNRSYGELDATDVIDATVQQTGLRPPARKSSLYEFVMERAFQVASKEVDNLEDPEYHASSALWEISCRYAAAYQLNPEAAIASCMRELTALGLDPIESDIERTFEGIVETMLDTSTDIDY